MAWLTRVGQNFELPGLVGMFAFLTLGFMSLTQGHPYFALFFVFLGTFFVVLACYNTYRNRSTELLDRYEERFFVKMKQERKLAAQYLLEQTPNNAHLKYILDFFEAQRDQ